MAEDTPESVARATLPSRDGEELRLSVEGYKAVRRKQELRIAPLTVIAGVNSSGKSSFMQPFLMMKQTLDSAFDPGPLLLYGANVKVTEHLQMFSRGKAKDDVVDQFTVGMRSGKDARGVTFGTGISGALKIRRDVTDANDRITVLADPLTARLRKRLEETSRDYAERYVGIFSGTDFSARGEPPQAQFEVSWQPQVVRNRCFLEPHLEFTVEERGNYRIPFPDDDEDEDRWVNLLRGIIHVPGLRGNPERAYQRSAVGSTYPGTFDTYVANIIFEWGQRDPEKLSSLAHDLEALGLTWKVLARRVNDASVELMVGRMPHAQQGGAFDLVSVADVGFGVSQTLPVLVALHAAGKGQIVYIEQPEIHLHPRAQLALADTVVKASARGVVVIVETHSSLLIRGIQTAIARGEIGRKSVSMNWFGRDVVDGSQEIAVAELDPSGRFGEWPLDFDDISRDADWAYLDAIESQA